MKRFEERKRAEVYKQAAAQQRQANVIKRKYEEAQVPGIFSNSTEAILIYYCTLNKFWENICKKINLTKKNLFLNKKNKK